MPWIDVVMIVLMIAAYVVWAFREPSSRVRVAALSAAAVAAIMVAVRRRPREEAQPEPDNREVQDGEIREMDDVVQGATGGESPDSRALRAWARDDDRNP